MQRVVLDIPVGSTAVGDRFDVHSNADRSGLAGNAIDADRAINGRPVPFHPLGVESTESHRQVTTPPLYHGWYRFAVTVMDALGNEGEDEPAEFDLCVTSGPQAPRNFRQTGVDGGRPIFAFTAPPQMR